MDEYSTFVGATDSVAIVCAERTRTYLLPDPTSESAWFNNNDTAHYRKMKFHAKYYTKAIRT